MYQSAIEIAQQIRSGQARATDIMESYLAQIKKHNPALNAVVLLLEEEALKTAVTCDQEAKEGKFRGPLYGVPMTIKEPFWLKGTKSTINSKMLKDWTAPDDAAIVKRLKKAGAIIMGKRTLQLARLSALGRYLPRRWQSL
jgi:Asp-tRNA(Asn)/Glu-tRNA(Gln) amidotransferase A subunit family amidase